MTAEPSPVGDRPDDKDLDGMTELALRAAAGDRAALGELCEEMIDPMYRLALRFCGDPTDAEDAAQEVMVRLVTGLSTFEGRSRFTTWAYTVAVRQLQRTKQRPAERSVAGPEPFGEFIDRHVDGAPFEGETKTEGDELAADVRLACTYGMLLCLSREQRIAYLIGDLLGFTDVVAAEIAEVAPATHRQRLSRARKVMRGLMAERCGLVRAGNPCRCSKLVQPSIEIGLLDRDAPAFARHRGVVLPIETDTLDRAAQELDLAAAAAEVYRSSPDVVHPETMWSALVESMPELLGLGGA